MDAQSARGYLNAILYGVDFHPDLGDDTIRRLADSLINQRHFPNPPQPYAEAIKVVVRAGEVPPDHLWMSQRYSERELFGFLERLDRHLDELRPWPRPAFLKLDVARWDEFAGARAVAHVDLDVHQLTGLLNRRPDEVEVSGERRPVAIIELGSGQVVALLGMPGRAARGFTLLQRDRTDAGEVLAQFCEYTKLAPSATSLSADDPH